MRLLLFINLIAIIVIAGALGRMYEGAPLPWKLELGPERAGAPAPAAHEPASAAAPASQDLSVTPRPNPKRTAPVVREVADEPARAKLRILTEGAYPPFNYRNGEGRLVGFDIDIAQAICARLQLDCTIETRAWNDLLPSLKRGEGDAVVASVLIPSRGRETLAADGSIAFSKAYYTTPGHFAARRDARLADASAEALTGRRIVVQSGTTHEAFLKARFPDSVIIDVTSLDVAEASLANDRADLLFADRNALLIWTMSGRGAACCRLVGVDYADPMYFGVGAGIALRADDGTLRARIDKALDAIKADGTQTQIAMRYFGQSIR